jgi:hypothetical protein
MNRIGPVCIAVTTWIIFSAALLPSVAEADCAQWDLSGHWKFRQTNGFDAYFDLQQTGSAITGTGAYCDGCGDRAFNLQHSGPVDGSINGGEFKFVAHWDGGPGGEYSGKVNPDVDGGAIGGATKDLSSPELNAAAWYGDRPAKCLVVATPPNQAPPHVTGIGKRKNPSHVTGIGKKKTTRVAKANDEVDIYKGPGGQFGAYQCGQLNCFMEKDETAPVLDFKDNWYKVQTNKVPDGSGWVAADHVDILP